MRRRVQFTGAGGRVGFHAGVGLRFVCALATIAGMSCLRAERAYAARLLDAQLAIDGSARPPGDRLDLAIVFLPGEKELTIELRAGLVPADATAAVVPVRASREQNRDRDGQFCLTAVLRPTGSQHVVRTSLAVSFEDLELAPGSHRIAYQVTGWCRGGLAFAHTTRVTEWAVQRKPQDGLRTIRYEVRRIVEATRRKTVFVPGERMRGDEPRTVDKKEAEVLEPQVIAEETKEQVAVSSPITVERRETDASGRLWIQPRDVQRQTQRRVLFATNRTRQEGDKLAEDLGPNLTFGFANVTIPTATHEPGRLELPSADSGGQPGFQVHSQVLVESLPADLGPYDVLVFVHGFKNSQQGP